MAKKLRIIATQILVLVFFFCGGLHYQAVLPLASADDEALSEDDQQEADVSDNSEDAPDRGSYGGLENKYGPELKDAPFALRFAFDHSTGLSWKTADYNDRGEFLTAWEEQQSAEEMAEADRKSAEEQEQSEKEYARMDAKAMEQQKADEASQKKLEEQLAEQQKKMENDAKFQDQQFKLLNLRQSQHTQ